MTTITYFSPDAFYRANDPKMAAIAKPQTLRVWRSKGKGPAYLKIGKRVLYAGDTLNQWLETKLVEPAAA